MTDPRREIRVADELRDHDHRIEEDAEAVATDGERAETVAPVDATAVVTGGRQRALPKQADPAAGLLAVRDLRTHFKLENGWVKAVDGVSFRLENGEALGLAGESGCGKTTTALSLVRILPSNARIRKGSSIELFGIDLVPKTEDQLRRYRWREISIVFQGAMNALNPVKRVGEQIAEPIEIRLGESEEHARKRAAELLELVGIPRKRAAAFPHELSGGMRQRAMIAMALACDPAIVIGDEPTTALDVMVQAQILRLLDDLQERLGLATLFITHDLSTLAAACRRLAVMYAGRIVEEGPSEEVFANPKHPYTRALAAAFPVIGDPAFRMNPSGLAGDPPDPRDLPSGCPFHPRCPVMRPVCPRAAVELWPAGPDRRAACVEVLDGEPPLR